jgi:phage host-nuclease inhibitor protein Gam
MLVCSRCACGLHHPYCAGDGAQRELSVLQRNVAKLYDKVTTLEQERDRLLTDVVNMKNDSEQRLADVRAEHERQVYTLQRHCDSLCDALRQELTVSCCSIHRRI